MSSDATAVTAARQPAGNKSRPFWKMFALGFVMLACFGLLLLIMFSFVSSVVGREFDAVTWTTRSFQYTREPFSGMQLSGIEYSGDRAISSVITTHVSGGVNAPTPDRWDLVNIYRSSRHAAGGAQILLDYLEATDIERQPYWETWTTKHPKAAPVLWGAVRDCVHLSRYDRLPKLFETARGLTEPDKLKVVVQSLMVQTALDEAQAKAAAGDTAAAGRAIKMGLFYDPASVELKNLANK